jgi:cyclophilin family peptidyl-prolyl cis-trans isomerase
LPFSFEFRRDKKANPMKFQNHLILAAGLIVLLVLSQRGNAQSILGAPSADSGIQVESLPGDNSPAGENQFSIPVPKVNFGQGVTNGDGDAGAVEGVVDEAVSPERVQELEQLNFTQLRTLIRDNNRLIDRNYIGMPLSDIALQVLVKKEIDRLNAENRLLNELLEPAAIAAFRDDPNGSPIAAVTVMDLLASKLSPRDRDSKYDPAAALKLVETILEIKGNNLGKVPDEKPEPDAEPLIKVIYQGYLACFGMQDFKKADEYLTRLENMPIGLKPEVREMFNETKAAWEEENAMREKDKAVKLPQVKLETSNGDVLIELFEDQTPETVANFVSLVEDGFYDGLEFFQVIPSMYARAGCSENDGTTIPGYRIRSEFDNPRGHFAGTVAMHNDGENTAGSQFMIIHRPDPSLKDKIVAFGRVIEGMDVVYGFNAVNRIRTKGGKATTIKKATVIYKRDHEYEPIKLEGDAPIPAIALPNDR